MAFKIEEINGKPVAYNIKTYNLCDPADLAKLPRYGIRGQNNDENDTTSDEPCYFGSIAILTTGTSTEVYKLTPDNEWTKM